MSDKPTMTWHELQREDHRIKMLKMWSQILREHAEEGCCLDKPDDEPRAYVCVIHGRFKGDHVMTREEWMGDLNER